MVFLLSGLDLFPLKLRKQCSEQKLVMAEKEQSRKQVCSVSRNTLFISRENLHPYDASLLVENLIICNRLKNKQKKMHDSILMAIKSQCRDHEAAGSGL